MLCSVFKNKIKSLEPLESMSSPFKMIERELLSTKKYRVHVQQVANAGLPTNNHYIKRKGKATQAGERLEPL